MVLGPRTRGLSTGEPSRGGLGVDASTTARFPVLPGTPAETAGRAASEEVTAHDPPDGILLARVNSGDSSALGLLFQRFSRPIRSIGRRILRDDSEADDLVQDVFLFIQRRSSIFDSSKGSAGSWIIQMAYQRAIERRRRLATRHFYNRADLQSTASHVVGIPTMEHDYSAEAVFGRNGLEKIMSALSEPQRETLRLFFFEGYTLSEIGVKMGQPLGNIRNHYYRALDKLRQQMFGRKVSGV
ncbi:MAG TPA: sigma-70 family RNA polymerase sigma factor [Terriglobales bacterium]|nr:sigma-70 family RNA polymerase sigma factor [Terriglobales bacterium]